MGVYGTNGAQNDGYFQFMANGQDWDTRSEFLHPEPARQQEFTWQTEAKGASMAVHGSLVAVQASERSLVVTHFISDVDVVRVECDAFAESNISGLQWSSAGGYLAVQCVSADQAQLMLMETYGWQRIACHVYGRGVPVLWAPTKPYLAVLDGNNIQVQHKPPFVLQGLQILICAEGKRI